jgi:glucose/mannose-6-phosphate isomerase
LSKKTPFVLADRNHAALAHEVRTQLHERSKVNAACYDAPECLHNLVESVRSTSHSSRVGLQEDRWVYYFLRSVDEEPRIAVRLDKTIDLVFRNRVPFAVLTAEGSNPYHRALFVTYFNAYMTTYLAVLNGVDPLPVPTMSWLKNVMKDIPREPAATVSDQEAGLHERQFGGPRRTIALFP